MADAKPFNVRTATELLEATAVPLPFLLEPILSPGSAALICGPSGVGKSFLALGLAQAVAGGGSSSAGPRRAPATCSAWTAK
jgi:hypothetical protein